jgi:hypothetical protein
MTDIFMDITAFVLYKFTKAEAQQQDPFVLGDFTREDTQKKPDPILLYDVTLDGISVPGFVLHDIILKPGEPPSKMVSFLTQVALCCRIDRCSIESWVAPFRTS